MQDKRVVVGLLGIAVCGVGAYYLLASSEAVAQIVEPEQVPSSDNDFFETVVSEPMIAMGLKEPFGIRHNNPTNLRYDKKNQWVGQVGEVSGFCDFDTPINGIRAAAHNLDSYARSGRNTIEKIIQSWAPAVENNVEAYINSVCASSGFNRSQIIYRSRGDYLPLLAAMIKHENGKQPYSTQTILAGINAA